MFFGSPELMLLYGRHSQVQILIVLNLYIIVLEDGELSQRLVSIEHFKEIFSYLCYDKDGASEDLKADVGCIHEVITANLIEALLKFLIFQVSSQHLKKNLVNMDDLHGHEYKHAKELG